MPVKIIDIESGINTCYVIKEKGAIMVDGGPPKMRASFLKSMKDASVDPEEIKLIVLTHGHFDHVGSAKEIQEITGAKIAIHEKDRNDLEQGFSKWPKGVTTWGKISASIFKPLLKNKITFPTVKANIILDNNGLSLNNYGIAGKIIYTPGHTTGSVSVLLDSGELFAGCLAHNRLPLTFHPALPIYAENIDLVKDSWRKVIDAGAKIVYPGHGKPFSVDIIKKYI
ncbi:MAG: MBL fold metallo-hydrolase [Aureibaculum sp.]|nr:MBL fold metallo-hydrolase [Aureibaculum sp.]